MTTTVGPARQRRKENRGSISLAHRSDDTGRGHYGLAGPSRVGERVAWLWLRTGPAS
jgi:hypothetical protein